MRIVLVLQDDPGRGAILPRGPQRGGEFPVVDVQRAIAPVVIPPARIAATAGSDLVHHHHGQPVIVRQPLQPPGDLEDGGRAAGRRARRRPDLEVATQGCGDAVDDDEADGQPPNDGGNAATIFARRGRRSFSHPGLGIARDDLPVEPIQNLQQLARGLGAVYRHVLQHPPRDVVGAPHPILPIRSGLVRRRRRSPTRPLERDLAKAGQAQLPLGVDVHRPAASSARRRRRNRCRHGELLGHVRLPGPRPPYDLGDGPDGDPPPQAGVEGRQAGGYPARDDDAAVGRQ